MKTQIAAGTIRWGSWGAKLSTEKMTNLIEQCMTNGIKTFDISDVYGNYTTEKEVGDAIKQMGIKRKDFHLKAH
jgi:predicted oxidoreductase